MIHPFFPLTRIKDLPFEESLGVLYHAAFYVAAINILCTVDVKLSVLQASSFNSRHNCEVPLPIRGTCPTHRNLPCKGSFAEEKLTDMPSAPQLEYLLSQPFSILGSCPDIPPGKSAVTPQFSII